MQGYHLGVQRMSLLSNLGHHLLLLSFKLHQFYPHVWNLSWLFSFGVAMLWIVNLIAYLLKLSLEAEEDFFLHVFLQLFWVIHHIWSQLCMPLPTQTRWNSIYAFNISQFIVFLKFQVKAFNLHSLVLDLQNLVFNLIVVIFLNLFIFAELSCQVRNHTV